VMSDGGRIVTTASWLHVEVDSSHICSKQLSGQGTEWFVGKCATMMQEEERKRGSLHVPLNPVLL
jgi:hypothetical protein